MQSSVFNWVDEQCIYERPLSFSLCIVRGITACTFPNTWFQLLFQELLEDHFGVGIISGPVHANVLYYFFSIFFIKRCILLRQDPLNSDNPLIQTIYMVPSLSVLTGFDCNLWGVKVLSLPKVYSTNHGQK